MHFRSCECVQWLTKKQIELNKDKRREYTPVLTDADECHKIFFIYRIADSLSLDSFSVTNGQNIKMECRIEMHNAHTSLVSVRGNSI